MIQVPFILGAALGAGAMMLLNNKKKVKESACSTIELAKSKVEDCVDTVKATADCIKEKKGAKESVTKSESNN